MLTVVCEKFLDIVIIITLIYATSCLLICHTLISSPWTGGLGLEAQKTGLGLGLNGNDLGLGLKTLRPRPHVVRPRGLVYCNVLISYSDAIVNFSLILATVAVKSVIIAFQECQSCIL